MSDACAWSGLGARLDSRDERDWAPARRRRSPLWLLPLCGALATLVPLTIAQRSLAQPLDEIALYGTAVGGSVSVTLEGVPVGVATLASESATDVASALAAALGADPTLQLLGITAQAVDHRVLSNGEFTSGISLDAGLLLVVEPGAVLSKQKISDTQGYLSDPGSPGTNPGGLLEDTDLFGLAATLGDLDGDGRQEFWLGVAQDDDGGMNRGAGYVLFLNADGSVAARQKVSDTAGGLSGPGNPGGVLENGNRFGARAARLGDLDDDGVTDVAVGVWRAHGGGFERGRVHVLRMNADGSVKATTTIDDGDLGGDVGDGDTFGRGLAWLGDLGGPGALSDVLAVGAPGDPGGGTNRGALYLLSLNPDGSLASHVKISAGGFPGVLADGDDLGRSVERLGDLDDDGRLEIAVGATLGGGGTGSVWIVSLDGDGVATSASEIAGAEVAGLDLDDRFGYHLASLGDLDGDGVEDLAAGAFLDDDGGTDRGALWLLFLNADGSVKSQRKLSASSPELVSELDDGDNFGAVAAADVDGDGVSDLVVGSPADDDGGNARGAAYVFLLEGAPAICGNSALDPGEACDGNALAAGECSSSCQIVFPVCGDGVIEGSETCDDANAVGGDGCAAACWTEVASETLFGTSMGGTIEVTIAGVTVAVTTLPAQSAAEVLAALAAAIEAHPTLSALGIRAAAIGGQLFVSDASSGYLPVDLGLSVTPIAAMTLAHTGAASFAASLAGPATPEDFDALADDDPVAVLGSLTLTTLPPVEAPMATTAFDTPSAPVSLGLDNLDEAFLDGDPFRLQLSQPADAVALRVVTSDPAALDEIVLVTPVGAAGNADLEESTLVDGGHVYFVGITSDTPFSDVVLGFDHDGATNFVYTLDDVSVRFVPEPGLLASLLAGLGLLAGLQRRRLRSAALVPLVLTVLAGGADADEPRPSLEDLQQQLDAMRSQLCTHSEAQGETLRPLFCDPACANLGELLTVIAPTCVTLSGYGEVCGSGRVVSCSVVGADVTATVETVGGDDCSIVYYGPCIPGACSPPLTCVGGSCAEVTCSAASPRQSTLTLQGIQPADAGDVVQRSFSGFLCDVAPSITSESVYWGEQMYLATTPPARDLCQPVPLNANDALACLAQIESALGATCAP